MRNAAGESDGVRVGIATSGPTAISRWTMKNNDYVGEEEGDGGGETKRCLEFLEILDR